ncbi:MAG TPA: FlgD immunoglobulin-like domain containing protein, partial [Thermoanaerobaculia bacterium]
DSPFDPFRLLPTFGTLLWAPNDRELAFLASGAGETSSRLDLDDSGRQAPLLSGESEILRGAFSPTGRRLYYAPAQPIADPASPCFHHGRDQWALQSLANLTAELHPRLSGAGSGGVLLEGTASDLHFARYTLEYATAAAPDAWREIAPPSSTPVIAGRFTTWVPPAPGSYLVRLTAADRAGNVRQAVARVSTVETPSLTDLSLAPRLVSPAHGGAQVHYRVLAPLHLAFQFVDAAGHAVRTIERDHSTAGPNDLAWDLRDDAGRLVPDGEYRLHVQGYELFVTVDATPPAVTVALAGARQCVSEGPARLVQLAPRLDVAVSDANLDPASVRVETASGEAPASWQPFDAGASGLTLDQFVDRQFRVQASDLAGNTAAALSGLGAEELFVLRFGAHAVDPATGLLKDIGRLSCDGNDYHLTGGPVRFEAAESVRAPLAHLYLEWKPVPTGGLALLDAPGAPPWERREITSFLASPAPAGTVPDGQLAFVWDLAGVPPGVRVAVRLRGNDAAGVDHLSDLLTLRTDGMTVAVLPDDYATALPPELAQPIGQLLAQAGVQPQPRSVIYGREFVAEPLAQVTLYVQSDGDPRFLVPQTFRPAALTDGLFLFDLGASLRACTEYRAYAVAQTAAQVDPATGATSSRSVQSDLLTYRVPCLTVEAQTVALTGDRACGADAVGERTITLKPASLDGTVLQLLTLAGPDGVVYSVSRPESGRVYGVTVDTAARPEGPLNLTARLTNTNGESATAAVGVLVDRTPPQVAFTYPQPGQTVCGVPRGDRNAVDVQARIDDNAGNFSWVLEAQRSTDAAPIFQQIGSSPGASLHGTVGTLADTAGDFALHLKVTDAGGAVRCADTSFVFDGEVTSPSVESLPELFSPNGDGVNDTATVRFGAGEAVTVDVAVYPAERVVCQLSPTGRLRCTPSGPPLRQLASGLPVASTGTADWDGRDDAGAVVADGEYRFVVAFRDGCGNRDLLVSRVSVDTTPPAIALDFPQAGDPLPLVVEVRGAVHDANLAGWSVEAGAGSDEGPWAQLGSGTQEADSRILASWNTAGLASGATLRLVAIDLAGNRAEVRVPLVFASRAQLVADLEALPSPFSPNGDGRRETTAVRYALLTDALVDLRVLRADGTIARTLVASAARPQGAAVESWDGTLDGGAPAPDGAYRVELYARQASNPNVTEREAVTAVLDRTPPRITIAQPLDGGFTTGDARVVGTIADDNLKAYSVALTATPQAPQWSEIASGSLARTNAVLATLPNLAEGDYALRVTASDLADSETQTVVRFSVDGTPPVATLTAPAAGSVVGGSGTLVVAGAITEAHLASWRVEVGAGGAPTAWTTVASGTGLPLPSPLAAWSPAGFADGLYTLRLVAVDKAGQSAEARVVVTVDA